jgi:hypothetical protein
MKNVAPLLAALVVLLLLSGCSFDKTFALADTSDGTLAYCREVTTSDADVQDALVAAGYTPGTCAAQDFSGSACVYSGSIADGTAYSITEYFQGDGWTATYGSVADYCTLLEGTLQ